MMIFKLAKSAEKRWRRLKGHALLPDVLAGVEFKDGIRDTEQAQSKERCLSPYTRFDYSSLLGVWAQATFLVD
jgi:hypothetical protein